MPSTVVQKGLLGLSVVMILFGIALTSSGGFSPAWQVVDIREFRAEHQHGLWWDCIRAEKFVVAVGDFYDEAPLHCMYKFDSSAEIVIENVLNRIDEDGAAGEAEFHRFWAWQKIILFFIIASNALAFLSVCTGCCAPCFHPAAFVFTISLFIAVIFSLLADGIFFLAANRVDNRFVTGMVGTYEQRIGYAFYLHLGGTICWMGAFVCALLTTYQFIASNGRSKSKSSNGISTLGGGGSGAYPSRQSYLDAESHAFNPLLASSNTDGIDQIEPPRRAAHRSMPAPAPSKRRGDYPSKPLLKKSPAIRNVPITVSKGYSAPPSLNQYPHSGGGANGQMVVERSQQAFNSSSHYPDYPRAFRETSA